MTAKKKKEVLTLTEDKVNSELFDVEWDLADKTQDLMTVLNKKRYAWQKEDWEVKEAIEKLLEKRYNLMSAQCLFYDMGEKT